MEPVNIVGYNKLFYRQPQWVIAWQRQISHKGSAFRTLHIPNSSRHGGRLSSMQWFCGNVIEWLAAGRAADDNEWLTVALSVARHKERPVEDDPHFGEDAAVVSRDPFSPLMMCYALVWLNDKSSYVKRKPRTVINQTKKAILSCPFCFPGCNWICPSGQ